MYVQNTRSHDENLTEGEPFLYSPRMGRPKVKTVRFQARFTQHTDEILSLLETMTGKNRTTIIEEAVLEFANARGVSLPVRLPSGASLLNEKSGEFDTKA